MKLLSWNVRGLSSAQKRAQIKASIFAYEPDFVILTETKLTYVSKKLIKSIWSPISINWAFLNSSGRSGGIIVMWNDQNFSILSVFKGAFSVSIQVGSNNAASWWLSAIYGPAKRKNRPLFWEELEHLKSICLPTWILGGDFNVIRWKEETTTKNPASLSMKRFNSFISNCNLIDPPLSNAKYTWSNLRAQATLSRLDRFLFTSHWENIFPGHTSKVLTRTTSDHFPIVLESSMISWGPSPFRFTNAYLNDPDYKKNIEFWWGNTSQPGYAGYSFMRRLKQLALKIKTWGRDKKGKNEASKKACIKEIDQIDKLEAEGSATEIHREKRTALKADLSQINLTEAQIWAQKCKRIWVHEGDENSSFFHKICTARQKKCLISKIINNSGQNCLNDSDIADAFIQHFEDIYTDNRNSHLFIENLDWCPISNTNSELLDKPFNEAEIWLTLKSFAKNKAPGPDGYTMDFLQKSWSFMKQNICDIFKDFHSTHIINKAVNETLITLIAKKEHCETVADFRPISLTTAIYKLIAKTLADRLKQTLPETISESQMAFVKGRQITEAILIANEALDFWRSKKERGFVIKLDIEKAFDKLNWRFIDFVLMKKNYSQKWRKMIASCISSVQYSILINGRPRGRIKPSRGIRQGDPLSPFIFVLAMDYLSRLLNNLADKRKINGVNFSPSLNLTHILFADDILIFVEDRDDYVSNLKMILHLFESASGLNINLSKSTIFPINVPTDRAKSIADSWGISKGHLPTSYLGMPLGGRPSSSNFWNNVLQKIQKKLSSWKYSQLSKGGRITLINSTLESLPTYQMSVFKVPKGIAQKIEASWRNFLWNGASNGHNISLIRWNQIVSPKEKGGLGIHSVNSTNFALLCKWLWKFLTEKDPLWKRLIISKYDKEKMGSFPSHGKFSSNNSPWKAVTECISWFYNNISWKVNDGDDISFWLDNWNGNAPLSLAVPRLFALSTNKKGSVKEFWNPSSNDWHLHINRPLRDHEENLWHNIKASLPTPLPNRGHPKPLWKLNSNNIFDTASVKRALAEVPISPANFHPNLYKTLWKVEFPKKCKFFIWTLIHGCINTADRLQKRLPNWTLSPNWCYMCNKSQEDINHLFIHCPYSQSAVME
ncbi:hypothetical protein IC582_000218 [Cucumis melo]